MLVNAYLSESDYQEFLKLVEFYAWEEEFISNEAAAGYLLVRGLKEAIQELEKSK